MKEEELKELLDRWSKPEELEQLEIALSRIVRGLNSEDRFKYKDVFCAFQTANLQAIQIEQYNREAREESERASKFYNECYEQKLAEGCTEEEARAFAEEETSAYY